MNINSRIFLKKKFKDYYFRNKIAAPPEIRKREFGVGTLDAKIKARHKSFPNERELNNYLKREAPFYISYSCAYYEFPKNQPMTQKNWLGADLIFDLDADMTFLNRPILEGVKEETLNLIDFLTSDFSFPKKNIKVNFSGSKGYHIHVMDEEIRELRGEERREIVDYVSGDVDFKNYLRQEVDKASGTEIITGPKKGDLGWPGRIYRGIHDFILNSDLRELKTVDGIGDKKAHEIYGNREKILKELERGRYDHIPEIVKISRSTLQTSDPNVRTSVIKEIKSPVAQRIVDDKAVKTLAAEDTDKMVTIDTSRLIRLPGSLHGGSGLKASTVRDLERFDPLRDSVVFGEEKIEVDIREDIPGFHLMEGEFGPLGKGKTRLEEYAAVYLMLKDKAEIVKKRNQ